MGRRRWAATRPGDAEHGSTVPLILLFFLIALLVVAGSVALGDAALDQTDLQSTCDSAGVAVAAKSVAIGRDDTTRETSFDAAKVTTALRAYLARDPARTTLELAPTLSPDGLTLTLRCRQSMPVTFGAVFGRSDVIHTATSAVRAPAAIR